MFGLIPKSDTVAELKSSLIFSRLNSPALGKTLIGAITITLLQITGYFHGVLHAGS